MELVVHVVDGRRRCALRERDGERAVPHTAVVVADRPAAGATDRVARGDADRRTVGDAQEVLLPPADDEPRQQHGADEAAPVHEARATEQRGDAGLVDREVDLSADDRAEQRGEGHVVHDLRIVAALLQHALRDEVRDAERGHHRETETGELDPAEVELEWIVHDRRREHHLDLVFRLTFNLVQMTTAAQSLPRRLELDGRGRTGRIHLDRRCLLGTHERVEITRLELLPLRAVHVHGHAALRGRRCAWT